MSDVTVGVCKTRSQCEKIRKQQVHMIAHSHAHTAVHTLTHTQPCTHSHTQTCTHSHTHTQICTHTCIHTQTCIHTCIQKPTHAHSNAQTHTQTRSDNTMYHQRQCCLEPKERCWSSAPQSLLRDETIQHLCMRRTSTWHHRHLQGHTGPSLTCLALWSRNGSSGGG